MRVGRASRNHTGARRLSSSLAAFATTFAIKAALMATSMKFVGKIRHVFGIAMPSNHNVGQDVDKIIIPILRIGMPVLVGHISPDTGGFWHQRHKL